MEPRWKKKKRYPMRPECCIEEKRYLMGPGFRPDKKRCLIKPECWKKKHFPMKPG